MEIKHKGRKKKIEKDKKKLSKNQSKKKKEKMVYLFNEHIPPKKIIKNALTAIYGIGIKRAQKIGNEMCVNTKKRFNTIKIGTIRKISKCISKRYKVGGILQKQVNEDIKKKIKIKSYQGMRHKNKLPVRGQRTHTNAQTQKRRKG